MEPVGPGSTEMKEADTEGTFGPASGLHEYELTMDVSKKVRAELEDRGYEVKLTHFDTFNPISCTERAAVANENEADAFIRIHANGSENTSSNGAMTICITKDNPYHPELYSASARLSQILLENTAEDTILHKIIRQRHYLVYGLPYLLCQISDGAFGAQPCCESEISFII